MVKASTIGILVATIAVGAYFLTNGSAGEGMEWKEVRIGVWVAKLGLMKPLYDFLALYGPEINTMNYGINSPDADVALEPPLRELDRFSVNLYNKCMKGGDKDQQLSVTEVGCGRGGGLYALRHIYPQHKFTGYDLSAPAVDDAQKRFGKEGLVYAVGNALEIPAKDCSQDIVVNVESSHNYPDLSKFFSEVNRVLKKGGHFGYTDIMDSKLTAKRLQMLKESGMTVKYSENITSLVLDSIGSEQHNKNKIEMVNEHYGNMPGWLQMVLPKKLFANLAGVQGSPQHNHFADGSETYMLYELEGSGTHCNN
jgi:ubiquinone/menaquinone biosynthesis C-methylase UbiE